jgi:hypothetical protein
MPQAKILKARAGKGFVWSQGSIQDIPEPMLKFLEERGEAERLDNGGSKTATPKAKRTRKAVKKAPEER